MSELLSLNFGSDKENLKHCGFSNTLLFCFQGYFLMPSYVIIPYNYNETLQNLPLLYVIHYFSCVNLISHNSGVSSNYMCETLALIMSQLSHFNFDPDAIKENLKHIQIMSLLIKFQPIVVDYTGLSFSFYFILFFAALSYFLYAKIYILEKYSTH